MSDAPQPDPKHERTITRAVLQWIRGLRAEVAIEAVEGALFTGSAVQILAAISRAKQLVLNLMPVASEAGTQAMDDLDAAQRLSLRFDIHDPRFELAVERLGAHAIVEVDMETKAAVRSIIADGYRNGWHPKVFAPTIAETVGLTTRDSKAVARQFATMLDNGMRPDAAEARAKRYADRLARNRAMTIGITETHSAHVVSRREAWLQAQRNGLFAGRQVYEEWLSVQTDPNEICFRQNGKRVPLGSTFDGLYPPAHPRCRCQTVPVFE